MSKKIGILTLVSADNCGSLLQAYALKNTLLTYYNVETELIPFFPKNARKMYRVFHPSVFAKPKEFMVTLRKMPQLTSQVKAYNQFREEYLQISDNRLKTRAELEAYLSKFDSVIVGSDQVWNVNMFDFDLEYFLPNFQGKRYSYAASLGGNEKNVIPQKLMEQKSNIQNFNSISIREPQGAKMIASLTTNEVEVCIDPTLLLPQRQWLNLSKEKVAEGDYIFYYSYNYAEKNLCQLVADCSRRLGMPVYVINASRWIKHQPEDYGFKFTSKDGPLGFLSLMRHAKYVFVQSLHGAIFASIFQRNYWFLNNRDTDVIDPRSENILSLLGTRARTLRPNNYKNVDIKKPHDYSINEILDKEREKSLGFLKNILEV